jgi:signal transduction histidine kinase
MKKKKSFFIKQKVIFVLLLFSFFAFGGIIYTFRASTVLDSQHIQLVEFSEKVEIEVFNGRIKMEELLNGNETVTESSVIESFARADKYISNIEQISSKSKKINLYRENHFLHQLSELKIFIHQLKDIVRARINKDMKRVDSNLSDSYLDFTLKFDEYEKVLHSYINESNYRLKREIFILLASIFIVLIISLVLIVRLMNSLIVANRVLLQNTMKVEQSERRRIAMDLHDGLGAMLSSVGLYSKILEKEFKTDKKTHDKLSQITLLSNQALQTVSEVINNLNPSILNRHDIVESLDRLCHRINGIGNLKLHFESKGFIGEMNKSREVILYRICSELINNTIKHANATNAFITLSRKSKLVLHYQDNGSGFDRKELSVHENNRMGLSNIVDRVESIGGQCFIETTPGNGFEITIELGIDK